MVHIAFIKYPRYPLGHIIGVWCKIVRRMARVMGMRVSKRDPILPYPYNISLTQNTLVGSCTPAGDDSNPVQRRMYWQLRLRNMHVRYKQT